MQVLSKYPLKGKRERRDSSYANSQLGQESAKLFFKGLYGKYFKLLLQLWSCGEKATIDHRYVPIKLYKHGWWPIFDPMIIVL